MNYLPLFHHHSAINAVIIGGGQVAFRRAELLIKCQITPTVVCKQSELDWSSIGITPKVKAYEPQDLTQANLVIVATNDSDLNAQIAAQCQSQNVLVNVVSDASLGNVVFPAIVDRDPMCIAIASDGQSPSLTRIIRHQIEELLPPKLGLLAKFAGKWRHTVKQTLVHSSAIKAFWQNAFSGNLAEKVYNQQNDLADDQLKQDLSSNSEHIGEVYLVGAGPGDVELLTIKALRLIQKAEVVLFDRLVSQDILDLVPRDAQMINVGKARDKHLVPQDDINQLLVDLALQGKRVVRLKGGDPFIFGRGAEEIEKLLAFNIRFQVVPGITAAAGCSAYAGIPLTHRDHSQSVRFITGHLKDGSNNLPWHEYIAENQTLVFYMGLSNLNEICAQLIQHGKTASTPAAIVQKGTTSEQKTVTGTLTSLPELVLAHKIKAPTLIIIGNVVSLHTKLTWFEKHHD